MTRLIVILGDQLSPTLSALRDGDPKSDHILMAEVLAEGRYVPHHKKKIAFILSAMRHFADGLRADGFTLHYSKLDDMDNSQTLVGEIKRRCGETDYSQIVMTEAGEWRLRQEFEQLSRTSKVPLSIYEDDRFICSASEFKQWAEGRKQLRMEYFYRDMRRKTGLLMDNNKPEGGQWNYDSENRKPTSDDLFMPAPPKTKPDAITAQVIDLVNATYGDHMGDLSDFWFAVDADGAQQALDAFIENGLKDFGTYQDAMVGGQKFLYHSVLSHYINCGLLDGLSVCKRVAEAYAQGRVPINSAEGFIRQIIGWRDYVRGLYFLKMPEYAGLNHLKADRALPDFYWTGKTDMACMKAAIDQTIDEAYAHHIQRLMITGNFALIAGVDPHQVHEWYLSVYADAYEWVELPNTLGMSQYADGGILGSKPYAASGNYIHKMSDHCGDCRYRVQDKVGPDSCPFNALYWDFMIRNRDTLAGNPRISRVYSTWDRMKDDKKSDYLDTAAQTLKKLDSGQRL